MKSPLMLSRIGESKFLWLALINSEIYNNFNIQMFSKDSFEQRQLAFEQPMDQIDIFSVFTYHFLSNLPKVYFYSFYLYATVIIFTK